MRLSIEEDRQLDDIEVHIRCARIDERVQRIIEAAEAEGRTLTAFSDGFLRVVNPADVLYAEYVDGNTFLYLTDAVLESVRGLGALEQEATSDEFVRASRTTLVNLRHVSGLRPYLGGRLELILSNGEHLIASRQFAPSIKKRIGL